MKIKIHLITNFTVVKDILVEKGPQWIDWIHSIYVEIMVKSLTGMLKFTYLEVS